MGHLGLTPQSVNAMGGLRRRQGRDLESASAIELDAKALADAGCFAIVLEGVPDVLAARVTAAIEIPTIGIGAGAACDGQVLVLHDIIGLSSRPPAKFVRQYADVTTVVRERSLGVCLPMFVPARSRATTRPTTGPRRYETALAARPGSCCAVGPSGGGWATVTDAPRQRWSDRGGYHARVPIHPCPID